MAIFQAAYALYFVCMPFVLSIFGITTGIATSFHVIPMWNESMITSKTDCALTNSDNGYDDAVIFHGSPFETCTVMVEVTNPESALMISRVSDDVTLDFIHIYAEDPGEENTELNCHNRFITITRDKVLCPTVIRPTQSNLMLHLQGNTSVLLSHVFLNETSTVGLLIPEDQLSPSMPNVTTDCMVGEYNRSIQCESVSNPYNVHGAPPDSHTSGRCSLTFPADCTASLGNREVTLGCHTRSGEYYKTSAMLMYPQIFSSLDLVGKNITDITIGAFYGMISLTTLELVFNQLETLVSRVFEGLGNLKILNMRDNRLATIGSHVFDDTPKLQVLSLSLNRLTSIPARLFRKLEHLAEIYLYGNRLALLRSDYLYGLHNLRAMYYHNNGLLSLDVGTFLFIPNLTSLDMAYNKLTMIDSDVFADLINLKYLRLKGNRITEFDSSSFTHFENIFFLSLSTNNLTLLPEGVFHPIPTLIEIYLQENQLITIEPYTFSGLVHLTTLTLARNQLTIIDERMFTDLIKLAFLDLSENELKNIPNIKHISTIQFLNLISNRLTWVTEDTFVNLSHSAELLVSQHEVCNCYFANGVKCSAANARSPYLTCDRLLTNRNFLAMTWIIGLNALLGNLFVLAWRQIHQQKNKVQSLLLGNLAVSDLLMGLYMIIIACADIRFGTHFPMQAERWRSGITCRIAGALSILSSEASVFFITLISIDRLISIKYPHSSKRFGRRSKIVTVIVTWVISLAVSVIPSVLAGNNYKFYDNSHVCIGLPLAQIGLYTTESVDERICKATGYCYYYTTYKSQYAGSVSGMYFSTAVFLGLNCMSYIIILGCYIEIIRVVYLSSKRAGLNKEMKEQIRLTAKVAAIVLTDFICWFPVILLGILVQSGLLKLPPSVYAWFVTFILPVNSAINPYLYTIAAIVSSNRKKKEMQGTSTEGTRSTHLPRMPNEQPHDIELQTQTVPNDCQGVLEILPNVPMAESNV